MAGSLVTLAVTLNEPLSAGGGLPMGGGQQIYSGGGNAIITVQESTPQANFTLYGNPNNFAQLYLYDPANGNSSQASISPIVNALNQAISDTVTMKGKSKLIVWRQHTDDTQSAINPF